MTDSGIQLESERNPTGSRARAYAGVPNPNPVPNNNTPSLQASVVDMGGGGVEDLTSRGVSTPTANGLFVQFGAAQVRKAIEWWDGQKDAGAGLLVHAVREGRGPSLARNAIDREREYGRRVCGWLSENFPELDRPAHGPHPAAVAVVTRLHWTEGKGSLTRALHGETILSAVAAWEERWAA